MNKSTVFEYRGIDSVYYAKVLTDTKEGITFDEPKYLCPVAELTRETDSSTEAHYYDNKALISLSSEGADTVTLTTSVIPLDILSDILGRYFDKELGAMSENSGNAPDIAILYRSKGTDGYYRYVTRYKCKASIPNDTVATENEGTDANGQELTLTGVNTTFDFTKGGSAKALVIDTRIGNADISKFFTEVQTIDSIKAQTSPIE